MDIDWSKAPEGATHVCVEGYGFPWRRQKGAEWFCWTYRGWEPIVPNIPLYKAKPEPWTGEGLPPVGTVCEVDYCESWQRCEVIAHFRQRCGMVAAFTVDLVDGAKSLDAFGSDEFRPIRTPEQIAEEERKRITDDIQRVCVDGENNGVPFHEALYQAGYRKFEIVEGE